LSKKGGGILFKSKEIEFKVELLFKILYFILTLLSFNTFTARTMFISVLSYAVVFFSGVIFVSRITHIKDYINTLTILLCCFIFSYILASINTIQYGIIENIQAAVWMCIQFFIVFARDKNQPNIYSEKEFSILMSFFLIYSWLMSVIALVMMAIGWEYYAMIDGKYIIGGGFLWNRLYGAYIDPNYGAIFCLVSIFISLFFLKKTLKKPIKILLIVNIVTEYLYICYSDSRTGRLAVLLSVFIYVVLTLYKKDIVCNWTVHRSKRFVICILASIVASAAIWGSIFVVRNVTSFTRQTIAKIQIQSELEQSGEQLSDEEIIAIIDEHRVGRYDEEINDGDVSNNRFAIWENAIEIFKENPILGISYRNIQNYANDKMPNGFIAKSGFESMHNTFFDVLVSQGLFGIILLFSLLFSYLREIINKYSTNCVDRYLLSIIIAVSTTMLSYTEVLYINTGGAFVFFLVSGLIMGKENK